MKNLMKFLDFYNIFIINDYPNGYSVHKGTMYCKQLLFSNVETEREAIKLAMNHIIDNMED